jgi:hypothetical protein
VVLKGDELKDGWFRLLGNLKEEVGVETTAAHHFSGPNGIMIAALFLGGFF